MSNFQHPLYLLVSLVAQWHSILLLSYSTRLIQASSCHITVTPHTFTLCWAQVAQINSVINAPQIKMEQRNVSHADKTFISITMVVSKPVPMATLHINCTWLASNVPPIAIPVMVFTGTTVSNVKTQPYYPTVDYVPNNVHQAMQRKVTALVITNVSIQDAGCVVLVGSVTNVYQIIQASLIVNGNNYCLPSSCHTLLHLSLCMLSCHLCSSWSGKELL